MNIALTRWRARCEAELRDNAHHAEFSRGVGVALKYGLALDPAEALHVLKRVAERTPPGGEALGIMVARAWLREAIASVAAN